MIPVLEIYEALKKQQEWEKPFPCSECGKMISKKDMGLFAPDRTNCNTCFFGE